MLKTCINAFCSQSSPMYVMTIKVRQIFENCFSFTLRLGINYDSSFRIIKKTRKKGQKKKDNFSSRCSTSMKQFLYLSFSHKMKKSLENSTTYGMSRLSRDTPKSRVKVFAKRHRAGLVS